MSLFGVQVQPSHANQPTSPCTDTRRRAGQLPWW
jgi:hypothetical protein